jgi:bifunctional non-homologous end joining protein LigD
MEGKDTTGLPLSDRKALLKKILPKNEVIRYSDHIAGKGKAFFAASKKKDLEGIMAKKADSEYFPGKRTGDWLKIKHHRTAEVTIVGYTAPSGSRKYFGALVLASRKGSEWIYSGHTGTGFTHQSLKEMYELLQPLVQKKSPLGKTIKTNSAVTWVKPRYIAEIKFTEVTRDGRFRHPVFLHLRNDKNLNEINMENSKNVKPATVSKKAAATKSARGKPPASEREAGKNGNERVYTFGKNKVKVSHADKIYFPEEGISKGDVAEYYISIAEYILPYLKGRPESLLRNPNGILEQGFFQKDAAGNAPAYVKSRKVHSESNNKDINYILCDNLATLVYLNNLGCIEMNPWHTTVQSIDKPDYMIIDIDPSRNNTFDQVIEAALVVKQVLDKAGAASYCKTSGSTGMHIYVPTGKKYSFEQVKDFAYLVCMMASDELKDFTTLERNLSKRGHKHIYMDYLQNRSGQTIASVYSLRPKPGATVSAPLLWKEVKKGLSPEQFTINNMLQRIKKTGDIFKGVLGRGIDLKKCLKNLEG